MKYTNVFNTRNTPQNQPIPGTGQAANSAGGFAWAVSDWTRLNRFLILGSEGATYYASEKKLTRENAEAVLRCIQADGERVVREIVAVSDAGRAAKNDPALFALAMCAGLGNEATRKAALNALPAVARIATHLFHFCEYVEGFRGWGRGLRQAVGNWYDRMPTAQLALQIVKYRQRDKWTHRDLLRLSHPKTDDPIRNALYHWIVDGWESVGDEPHPDADLRTLWAFERLQKADSVAEAARIVREYNLPMETVPSELRGREVWEAVLPHSGLTFIIRNLGNLSKCGILAEGNKAETAEIAARISNGAALKRARVHPIQILSALTTYKTGRGAKGSGEWTVSPAIVDALDAAFYASFGNIEPTGKRWVLALDISGSMAMGHIAGVPGLTPRVGSAAMAMATYHVEPDVSLVAFTAGTGGTGGQWGGGQSGMTPLTISRKQRLDDVIKAVSALPMGGTDCALPMLWAMKNKVEADAFVIYTDSETWAGAIHPVQALRQYREQTGIPARLIVVGMTSSGFTIADPNDAGMLDIAGFDTAAPEIIRQFAAGTL